MTNGIRTGMLTILLLALYALPAAAQLISTHPPITTRAQILLHLDRLEDTWEVQQARAIAERKGSAPGIDVERPLPGELDLKLKLQTISEEALQLRVVPEVREYIRLFSQQRRDPMEAVMGLAGAYLPEIEQQLNAAGLPRLLRFFPVALSALNVRAVGESGHSGLWQLNYHTAIRYGLRCDRYIDERRAPVQATQAAIAYLKDLKSTYDDWFVALTAYVCGPGSITRARNRAGKDAGFEAIYPHLPKSGRDYVAAFVAAAYVMNYHQLLGLQPLEVPVPEQPDRIQLDEPLDFAPIAQVLGLPLQQLQAMNPMCRQVTFPGDDESVWLCLPRGYRGTFEQLKDSIFAVQARYLLPETEPEPEPEPEPVTEPKKIPEAKIPSGSVELSYTIKSGDNLGAISRWYDVSLSDLRGWNKLANDYIRAGDRLKVYVPKDKATQLREVDRMSLEQKQIMIGEGEPAPKAPDNTGSTAQDRYEYYTVQSGDNLWIISRKYPGISAEDIMKLNDITEDIHPGMRLKIPLKPQ